MAKPKALTREQLQGRKEKAERFTRDVLDDPGRAEEIADESLESYAERRGIQLLNPPKRREAVMPAKRRMTREELEDRAGELESQLDEVEEERDELQKQLDSIAEIVSPEEKAEGGHADGDDESEDEDWAITFSDVIHSLGAPHRRRVPVMGRAPDRTAPASPETPASPNAKSGGCEASVSPKSRSAS